MISFWCPKWDLNPYGFLHSILSRTRIPIPPFGLRFAQPDASQGANGLRLEAPLGPWAPTVTPKNRRFFGGADRN